MRIRLALIASACLLSVALLTACGSQPAATSIPALAIPASPAQISVPNSQRPILKARRVGVQTYACRANSGQVGESHSYGWTLKAPDNTGIPWLLVRAMLPEGVVRRVQTVGGKAPATGCDLATEDREVRVPYETTYSFSVNTL